MHLATDTVTDKLSHYTKILSLTIGLDRMTYVSYPPANMDGINTFLQGFHSGVEEMTHTRIHLTYRKGKSTVTGKSIEDRTTVYADHVSLF